MDRNDVREVIKFLAKCLRENGVEPLRVILFGSQSRGEATEESDIDIVVLSESFSNKGIFERADMIKGAERETIRHFLVPLDVIPMTPEEFDSGSSIIAEYAKSGEVIL